uniref:Uncharacterized protein n=1 Tax=Anguilla anguilla TaxID=7936 RepID=A0A0E9QTI9_ANGAN
MKTTIDHQKNLISSKHKMLCQFLQRSITVCMGVVNNAN